MPLVNKVVWYLLTAVLCASAIRFGLSAGHSTSPVMKAPIKVEKGAGKMLFQINGQPVVRKDKLEAMDDRDSEKRMIIKHLALLAEQQKQEKQMAYLAEQQKQKRKAAWQNEQINLLARIIEAEAGDQSYKGRIAVGSVVMNRVKHHEFPKNIKAVIFQHRGGFYQFEPVANGRIYNVSVSASSRSAAREAFFGQDPTNGALYFYDPKLTDDAWIRTRPVITVIGDHTFAQ
ncbi:cell wall hydrolase [Aneurinibacillus sp. Ricciae_BoGa-3]|uniref:cell wall hydrolase n=1 Tax=Aneurinibacillus sp. Ricciae_BoGa-3 TaxID=3022697 RepID=UPI002340FED0|nr:cell wall hydrolase [Aneurinibacillus sp. Ricciae_BoGa-3]WCK52766.1 cell wall hydrolase [Aneurinibacillus sp. Ricciae_BoGa-3]